MIPNFIFKILAVIAFIDVTSLAGNIQEYKPAVPETEYVIAYNVLYDGKNDNYEVFVMNMDGTGKKNITNLPGVEWTYLAVEDKILFISDKDTCRRCYFLYETDCMGSYIKKISEIRLDDSWMSCVNNEIIIKPHPKLDTLFYIINFNGNILQQVFTGLPSFSDPLFINMGNQIIFRGGMTKSKFEDGFNEELYIIDRSGDNLKQLTQYPQNVIPGGRFEYRAGPPKLQPKEKFITYQSYQNGKYSLFAVSPDGSKNWKLTDVSHNEGWHDWSPDGKWLAIELFDNEQTQFNIGLMNWETKELFMLTDTTYKYQQAPVFVLKK